MAYNTTQMRWMQQDPSRYVDGANLFGYVRSNPINHCDPTGLETQQERLDRYKATYEKEYNSTVYNSVNFETFAGGRELAEMRNKASNWNYSSPAWSPNNQCADQAKALEKFLETDFQPIFWDLKVVGGAKWLALRNHNVLGVIPKGKNQLPQMYFDPFKYTHHDLNMKIGCLCNFQKEYPYGVKQTK